MTDFNYRNQQLHIEDVALTEIAAEFGTPCYVYSKHTIQHNWLAFVNAFKNSKQAHKIFYAVKANSNLAILQVLAKLGANFDTVSGGEIDRVIAAGGMAKNIVFSGVGKTSAEIIQAIELGIHSINIESIAELQRVQELAKQSGKQINIAIRINPDIDANSHPYISTGGKQNKFGIDYKQAIEIYTLAANCTNLRIQGISCHIGSQITTLEPFLSALDQLLEIIDLLAKQNISIEFINLGGGLGIRYQDESPPSTAEYVTAILEKLKNRNIELHLEPGRSIVADAGILLTKIEYLKSTAEHNFAIVDAAMNDLIRPALYESYHLIQPVVYSQSATPTINYSIVGPVCESGDFLGKDRKLSVKAGDLLAIMTCGAYGFSMSSNYNTRPRCAEVLVAGDKAFLIRKRETIQQLLENEQLLNAE